MQRDFLAIVIGEQTFVSHVVPAENPSLKRCSFQVDAVGDGLVAPALRERFRIQRDELLAALREYEAQNISCRQALVLEAHSEGRYLKLSPFNMSSSNTSNLDLSGGILKSDTETVLISGPSDSVRLITT